MGEQVNPIYAQEHQRVIDKAVTLPVADAVFAIVHYNLHSRQMGPRPHCEEIPLHILHGLAPLEELVVWRARVLALRRDAYEVGEALLRNRERYEASRDQLIANHPGFNEESYSAAISFGCFQAR